MSFVQSEDGPSATEYAVLLALLTLGAMATIQSVGNGFRNIYVVIAGKIPNA